MIKWVGNIYTYEEIYQDIKNILKNDYAGCSEMKEIDSSGYKTVSNIMTAEDFEEQIEDFILDFNDGHLWFAAKESTFPNRGFTVRRYQDNLYVTEALQEQRLEISDKITHIDGKTIPELYALYSKQLEQEDNERQVWGVVLKRLSIITVERFNHTFDLTLSDYEREPYEGIYNFKLLDDETALLKITDFAEEKPILDIINNNKETLRKIKNLIIDVRINYGGNDEFYFPLLHYIFGENVTFKDLFSEDEAMYTNYTKRNCELWVSELEEYMEQDLDEETVQSLQEEIETVKKNYGKGFLEVPEETDFEIKGTSEPENIYILSDYYCGSSGDTFVSNAKKSNKVTVVGRPTMGIMDYFNVVTVDYGEYIFNYSISKMHKNSFTYGKGVQPDIYIPWTPDHLSEDQDLIYVKQLIQKNNEYNTIN